MPGPVPAPASGQRGLQRADLLPSVDGLAAERAQLGFDGGSARPRTARGAATDHVHGARHERRALQRRPAARVDHHASRERGERMQAQGEALDRSEPPARAAQQLAEVVARDVLDDLAARVRAQPVAQDEGHAEHQVAHRAEAVAQWPGEVLEQALAERRIAGRVKRQPLAVFASAAASSLTRIPHRRSRSDRRARTRRSRRWPAQAQKRSTMPASSSGWAR